MKCPSCANEIDEESASRPSCGGVFDELTAAATRIMPERPKPRRGGGADSSSGRKGSGSDGARTEGRALSAWHAGGTILRLPVATALILFGFKASLAGQPLFRGAMADD